jgi:NADH-quinone oxidoreductase subunit M
VAVHGDVPLFAGFKWALGIDGIALVLIELTLFLMPICIGASWHSIRSACPNIWRPSC